MKLTEHFTLAELTVSSTAVRKGISNQPTDGHLPNLIKVAEALEVVREHFGRVIKVTSGYRSEALNKAVGGSKTSAHCSGLAADFTVEGIENKLVCQWIEKFFPDFDQVIYEFGPEGWVHLGLSNGVGRKQSLTAVKTTQKKTMYKPGIQDLWS